MYTFVSSLLRAKGNNKPYRNENISRMKISQVFSNFRDGYIELRNPALTSNTYVSLDDLKAAKNLVYTDLPFNDWLTVQGNTTIFGTVETKPKLETGMVSFSDAIQAGFKLQRVNPADIAGKNSYVSDQLTDIYAIKNVGDPVLLHKRVLTNVNGLFHINIPSGNGLLIKGGGTSFNIEQDNLVGVLSFETVGEITQLPIRRAMITPSVNLREYRKAVYLNIKRDLRGKSLGLCFMGRLFFADDLIDIINFDGALRINLHRLDLFRIVQESLGKIDLRTLKLDEKIYHLDALTPENCTNDETVLAMLELLQTFLVIVDTPLLLTERLGTMYPNTPGYYETYVNHKLPYIDDLGVMHPYWKIIHKAKYKPIVRLHLKNTSYTNPVVETTGYRDPSFRYSTPYQFLNRRIFNTGHLLKITSQTIIAK